MECIKTNDEAEIAYLKGMQAFILSVEKTGYEDCYSEQMMELVRANGFPTLKEMIDSL